MIVSKCLVNDHGRRGCKWEVQIYSDYKKEAEITTISSIFFVWDISEARNSKQKLLRVRN